jgi:hypothetical protein
MFENFFAAWRASSDTTRTARSPIPSRAAEAAATLHPSQGRRPLVSFTEPEKIALKFGTSMLVAGGSMIFTGFAYDNHWTETTSALGVGLGILCTFFASVKCWDYFDEFGDWLDSASAATRYLRNNAHQYKNDANHWRQIALSAAGLAEAAGTEVDRAVPAANPKVIYPEWRR